MSHSVPRPPETVENVEDLVTTMKPVYDTPEGFALARRILSPLLPFDAHDYQIEGICAVMDGHDLVATMVTGGGKTGYFIMLMLVVCAISRNKTLALRNITFPKDPALIVVCPTKALQDDMASKMRKFDLNTTVINGDTYTDAQSHGRDLWREVEQACWSVRESFAPFSSLVRKV